MQNLEPGQIVQVNGKDATVISVGDGIVHLEQDGQAISVSPGEITIKVGDELPPVGEPEPSAAVPESGATQPSEGDAAASASE